MLKDLIFLNKNLECCKVKWQLQTEFLQLPFHENGVQLQNVVFCTIAAAGGHLSKDYCTRAKLFLCSLYKAITSIW
jgi:hypothetical protein